MESSGPAPEGKTRQEMGINGQAYEILLRNFAKGQDQCASRFYTQGKWG